VAACRELGSRCDTSPGVTCSVIGEKKDARLEAPVLFRVPTLSVVHERDPNHFVVAEVVRTAPGARTIALDSVTHKMYLPTASLGPANASKDEDDRVLPGTFAVLVVDETHKE
jgi:hypothetical protein